jgi:hypothetical protein
MKLYLFNSKQEKMEVNENTNMTPERNPLVQDSISILMDSNINPNAFYEQNYKIKD